MNKKPIIFTAVFLYLTAAALSAYISFRNNRIHSLEFIDQRLLTSLSQIQGMTNRNIFITPQEERLSLSEDETDIANMVELSQFCYQTGLDEISFLQENNGHFVYLASSSTPENMKTGDYAHANDFYAKDQHFLTEALSQNIPVFISLTDSRGSFRKCFKTIQLDNGFNALIMLSVHADEVLKTAVRALVRSLSVSIFFLTFLIPLIILILAYDRKERQNMSLKLFHDDLTGFPNKKHLTESNEKTREATLIILNIESLRKYNYYYGYSAGNTIIKSIAEKLEQWSERISSKFSIRPCIAKLQMDEFAVMIPVPLETGNRIQICNSLLDEFSGFCCIIYDQPIPVSVTIGAAYMIPAGSTKSRSIQDLYILADMALHTTKTSAKKLTIYNMEDMASVSHGDNFHITQLLRNSIEKGTIIPYFQPIISNTTGEIEKYESLIRIIDDTGELILPKKFLESARQSRIYPSLTKIMLNKTFSAFEKNNYGFAINISVEDILNPATLKYITEILESNPEISGRCIFEITDLSSLSDYSDITKITENLKKYGCRIAVDDFGSVFSNFKNIQMINTDYIKIDPLIIRNLQTDRNSKVIAETIVEYSKKMNISTIAQFVYNKAVFNEVKSIGIDYSQGNYLGIPAEKLM